MSNNFAMIQLLRRFQDSRCPRFGGYQLPDKSGRGMGRLIGNITFHGRKVNGKVVISNGAY